MLRQRPSPLEMVNPSWAFDPIDCDEEKTLTCACRGCVMHKVACGDVIEAPPLVENLILEISFIKSVLHAWARRLKTVLRPFTC